MKRIKLVPFYKKDTEERVFSETEIFNFPRTIRDTMRDAGYDLSTLHAFDECDFVLMFRLDVLTAYHIYKHNLFDRSIYLAMEPPVVKPMHAAENLQRLSNIVRYVMTWQDDLLTQPRIRKFFFPTPRGSRPTFVHFTQKRLITAIVGNKTSAYKDELYSERVKALKYFQDTLGKDFVFYGTGWNSRAFPCWQGQVDDKLETLSNFRFSLSFENQKNINGLISEKIFDSMLARCIPVFWGAPNAEQTIPSLCFIDATSFPNYEHLYLYLKSMSHQEYNTRLNAIEAFLDSDTFSCFSDKDLANRLIDTLGDSVDKITQPKLWTMLGTMSSLWMKDLYWRGINRLFRMI